MMKRLVITVLGGVIGLALLVAAGCRDSLSDMPRGTAVLNANEVELRIGLNVPGNFQSGLRAISDADERAIQSINVLVFKVDPGMVEEPTFMYSKPGTLWGANKDTLVVIVETMYDTLQQFVVITNVDAEIINLLQTDRRGASKSDLLAQLQVSLNEGEQWNVDATKFKALPMWGESVPAVITQENGSIHGIDGDDDSPIKLLRMVARINVKVTGIALFTPNKFKLDSVYLFNSNTAGLIVPNTANVNRNAGGEVYVIAPSIPPGLEMKRGKDAYIVYPASDDSLVNTIYTFESASIANNASDSATCVVIGGRFNGGTISYYRVDFADGSGNYFPILRNYQYNINITDVIARGYETLEEAFGAKSVNIATDDITPWEKEEQNEELDL
ncbi:hypothetical protein AGMMS49982_01680 [Bacteroidia bacterium]|nr:hypothetical protein AGMMS49982_01680 [Bacteroidia bacterium]